MSFQIRQITAPDDIMINTIVEWMYAWWGQSEGYSIDALMQYIKHSMQKQRLPQTYGLFLNHTLIGMYQFRFDDLFVRPDIYPWLANVYIDERFRGFGYGKELMQSIYFNAKHHLGFHELFLFTKHIGFYEKFGWEFISEIDTYLETCRVQRLYRLNLNDK